MLQRWGAFFSEYLAHAGAHEIILASWRRSQEAGVAPDRTGAMPRRVCEEELERRLQANRELLAVSRPLIQWLSSPASAATQVVYLTDADGIVLCSAGNDTALAEAFGLTPGHDWSEASMGTNGAGTALATGTPVAVVGPDHYVEAFENCTCTAAPIRDPHGRVIGALDISTSVEEARPERLVVVTHVAHAIERALRRGVQRLR